jgi:hypothetical protein
VDGSTILDRSKPLVLVVMGAEARALLRAERRASAELPLLKRASSEGEERLEAEGEENLVRFRPVPELSQSSDEAGSRDFRFGGSEGFVAEVVMQRRVVWQLKVTKACCGCLLWDKLTVLYVVD